MPLCECFENCPYFQSGTAKDIDAVAKVRQQEYCEGDFSKCARYIVYKALGRENVPSDLLPFQTDRAKSIIEHHKKPG